MQVALWLSLAELTFALILRNKILRKIASLCLLHAIPLFVMLICLRISAN